MADSGTQINTIAALTNVALTATALEKAINRSIHLPGMVVVHGHAGFGKSTAATYAANKFRAYYIECKSVWTRKATLDAILKEMGIPAPKTLSKMVDAICEELAVSQRPLIIDEMDHLVNKKAVEIVRDIYEGSGAPILLIGEEGLPKALERWERFHGRILDFVAAQPVDLDDAKQLANLYCKTVEVHDDLLQRILDVAHGSARRVCVNLERVQVEAKKMGYPEMNSDDWGNREFFTGRTSLRSRGY